MADGQHKLSRRALLGAVCAAPLVRHPGLGSHQSTTLMGSLDPESTFSLFAPKDRWIPDQVRDDGTRPRPPFGQIVIAIEQVTHPRYMQTGKAS